jgi:tryptophan 2,3-dioxygenase
MRSHSSSRNIVSLSQLQKAERQRIYDQHIKKMSEIDGQRLSAKKIKEEQNRIAEVLRKSKEVANSFKQLEQQNKRKQEDRKMVETLIDLQLKPRIRT